MSFLLDGSGDYLQNTGTPPVVNYGASGFTIAARYKRGNTTAAARTLVSLGQSGTANNAFSLIVGSGADVIARVRDGAAQNNASTSTTANDTDWHHACAVFASSTSRAAYLDGAGKGTNATSRSPADATRLRVGSLHDTSSEMLGNVAHAAIWDIALSDAEVAQLAAGASPASVQGEHLVWYCPMQADENPSQDAVAGYDLTLAGDTVYSEDNPATLALVSADTAVDGAAMTITGIAFGASQGASTVALKFSSLTEPQTVDTWTDSLLTINAVSSDTLPFGEVTLEVVVNGVTATLPVQHDPASGYAYVVADVPWDGEARSVFADASPAVADGDQAHYESATSLSSEIEVFPAGEVLIDSDSGSHEFAVRVFDQTDLSWSDWATMTISALATSADVGAATAGGDSPPHDRGHRGWKPRYQESDLDEALATTARKVYRGEPLEDDPPVPPAPPANERETVLRARSRAVASQLRAQRLASLLNSRH